MKHSQIQQIKVVSNTHWDREFRRTFEKTRRRLLTMMDVTLDILEKDPDYASFTMDGHSIMIDDYLEMRRSAAPGGKAGERAQAHPRALLHAGGGV